MQYNLHWKQTLIPALFYWVEILDKETKELPNLNVCEEKLREPYWLDCKQLSQHGEIYDRSWNNAKDFKFPYGCYLAHIEYKTKNVLSDRLCADMLPQEDEEH